MITRIGIDYTAGIHQSAGIGRYTRELVSALATVIPSNGFQPEYRLFVAASDRNFGPALPGTNFAWCPSRLTERWLARVWYRLRLPLPITYWTGPLSLFHATDFVLPPIKRGTGSIVTIHDLSFVRQPETTMPGMSRHLNKWVPYSVERADHVIAVSEATRQDLIDLYYTRPEKISVLYHGVNPAFKPVEEKAKLKAICEKYKLGEHPFILSVGTIQPRKNYLRLIRAFANIDSPASLVIVGDRGWHYQDIFDEVARQRLADRVHFPGFIVDADLPVLYSAATLFVYPSLYEGFGLPALEAMACGTPVVASNQSSLPEVVGKAGILIDSQDEDAITAAMARVLADKGLRQTLTEAGLKQATKFSWPEMAKKLVALYEKVLQEK